MVYKEETITHLYVCTIMCNHSMMNSLPSDEKVCIFTLLILYVCIVCTRQVVSNLKAFSAINR